MDIISNNKLQEYKTKKLLFTKLCNSTCTIEGKFSNLEHNEEELIELIDPESPLVKMDNNYGHKVLAGYATVTEERKSNRGRKKKPKVVKHRIFQGDGTGFNSQTQITVLGTHIRFKPLIADKHCKRARLPTINDQLHPGWSGDIVNTELINKEYKIKIFRNGKFTVPGVLCEDLSDVGPPLNAICRYFSCLFIEDVQIIELFPVMRNYKCKLMEGNIDIRSLQRYCNQHFHHLTNIKFTDISDYLSNPAFLENDIHPRNIGWRDYIFDNVLMSPELDFMNFKYFLMESKSCKNLYVDMDKLQSTIKNDIPLTTYYKKIEKFVLTINETYFIELDDEIIKYITKFLIHDKLAEIEARFRKSRDNLLSHIKYDPEKYPGFLIKIKTPNEKKPDKKTTIKIFPSGKVNIDGANNRTEAEYIYYWLNSLLVDNPKLLYNPNEIDDDVDSEFSSDDEPNPVE